MVCLATMMTCFACAMVSLSFNGATDLHGHLNLCPTHSNSDLHELHHLLGHSQQLPQGRAIMWHEHDVMRCCRGDNKASVAARRRFSSTVGDHATARNIYQVCWDEHDLLHSLYITFSILST